MGAVALLIVLAILFGVIGVQQGLQWLLIIAVVLLVLGAFSGYRLR